MKKKILFLGASHHQMPPIIYANNCDYETITCDYIKENPGHKISHKQYYTSTTNINEVFKIAKKEKVDAIIAYASDPAAYTQAVVAKKLRLPGNPPESIKILSRKNLFRKFLKSNKFFTPDFKVFSKFYNFENYLNNIKFPIIIKPTDSSGSKGVTKIVNLINIRNKFFNALKYSSSKSVIVEEFKERVGFQIAGDGFVLNGRFIFSCYANEHFNEEINELLPIGESFPSVINKYLKKKIDRTIQKIFKKLKIKFGAFNFDIQIINNNKVMIIEIGPRNGGNLIPEVIKYFTGVDLIKLTVDIHLGKKIYKSSFKKVLNNSYCSYMIHSKVSGYLKRIFFRNIIKKKIITKNIYFNKGDKINRFNKSNDALGSLILKFSNINQTINFMKNSQKYIQILTK
jgi:biotin carboxylase